jgi:hypothetical protein
VAPALRGARDLNEAHVFADTILTAPEPQQTGAAETLERFGELRGERELDADSAHALIRELKAVGGDLRALRRTLTGRERGPELWAVVLALGPEETRRRIDAALGLR